MGVAIPTVQGHLAEIEQRLDVLERRIHALEELRQLLGDLKYEVEALQEA